MILIAGGALVLLGGGLGVGYYLTAGGTQGGAEQAAPPPETIGMIELEPFLANVNGSGGRRHARVAVKLAVAPEERASEIAADALAVARLRDEVLTLITSKSLEELTSPEGKEALRKDILAGTAKIVEPGTVKEALFAEFVVQ